MVLVLVLVAWIYHKTKLKARTTMSAPVFVPVSNHSVCLQQVKCAKFSSIRIRPRLLHQKCPNIWLICSRSQFYYTCIFLLQMLVQRQETEQELNQRIQKLSTEKSSLVERVASLQRTLANMETEKREIERQVSRQEKDKSALKKTLDKVNILNAFLVLFTPRSKRGQSAITKSQSETLWGSVSVRPQRKIHYPNCLFPLRLLSLPFRFTSYL